MSRPLRFTSLPMLVLALGVLAASCGSKADEVATPAPPPTSTVAVASVDLGRSVGADYHVTDATEVFRPHDVIYASILTQGASQSAALRVKWTFEDGQVVDQSERTIAPAGDAATEFHIAKPDGWPVGKYKLEVFVDEALAQAREFEVRAG
jgi:hypothetical protein